MFNVEARAAFFGWFKEIYQTYFVYRFEDKSTTEEDVVSYHLTWLPEGYTEVFNDETEETATVASMKRTKKVRFAP